MNREDRELLAELARVNSDVVPVAMRIMDDSATDQEQRALGEQLIAVGEQLRCRADGTNRTVVEGEIVGDVSLALPIHTVTTNLGGLTSNNRGVCGHLDPSGLQ